MAPLTVVVTLVCVLTVINLLVTAGVVRRLRELQERVAGSDAENLWWPAPGTPVGDFRATTVDGRVLSRGDLAGDVFAAFLSPTCEPCRELADSLVADPPAERVLAFVLTDDPGSGFVSELTGLADVCVVTPESEPVLAFGVKGWPTALRLTGGTVVAAGHRRDAVAPAPARAPR